MRRVPPRRIGLNLRKGLIRKRVNPPNTAACVKYDLLTRFDAVRSPFDKVQLYRTSRIGRRDQRDLNIWLGRHPTRIAGREKHAHESQKDIRSMLLEGGSVIGRFHIPLNVRNILTVSEADSSSRGGRNTEGQGIDPKAQLRKQRAIAHD
jgi:hypothetical protein